jgi:hypothetical protein
VWRVAFAPRKLADRNAGQSDCKNALARRAVTGPTWACHILELRRTHAPHGEGRRRKRRVERKPDACDGERQGCGNVSAGSGMRRQRDAMAVWARAIVRAPTRSRPASNTSRVWPNRGDTAATTMAELVRGTSRGSHASFVADPEGAAALSSAPSLPQAEQDAETLPMAHDREQPKLATRTPR